jgi:hypothetical protein
MKLFKAVLIVAVAVSALSLGACANKRETMSSSTTASSGSTYSK